MLWAACCLGLFGFRRAGEFTVTCAFDPSIHLTVQDLQVDAEVNPSSLRVCIKSSKSDPLRQEGFIYLGRGQAPLCPISALLAFLHLRGLVWSPVHRHPLSTFNSFSPVVLHPVCVTGGGNPWAVLRPQFSHWGRYDGRALRHSRSPYQDHGQVDQ